jgi:hypothetical protein
LDIQQCEVATQVGVRDIIGLQRVSLSLLPTAAALRVALRVAMVHPELLAEVQPLQERAAMFGTELL